ncbi:large subunit ribosomal protein L6 [Anaerobranca californiensis DSM 14826]|jgi:large subunit ribosomal protein L6|uniref:Large ribosomal subunit protein uL6 n=1 Tax=Anaerobranca californiensis DSM 14826 TaxID=1120989 RepID=A0A1M6MZX2_9FIRM|nr:50S ribosomal protein L6 [Anaerobranca californiensis]SHJ89001.1 large subunit ribosomal protein L6 [Anaerobranca californiensis DSM 14826]
MSRIGKKPVVIPQGVEVKIDGNNVVTVKGPKGQLTKSFSPEMNIVVEEGNVVVTTPSNDKKHRSLHGLTRTLIANMVEGVTQGFFKNLELVGVGYRAQLQGNKLVLSMGYSHPVEFVAPEGITFEVPAQTKITVRGIDKQLVGQIAAEIRSVREPEPYLGKGIRYEGENVRRKEGKTGKK